MRSSGHAATWPWALAIDQENKKSNLNKNILFLSISLPLSLIAPLLSHVHI